ncbi:MAG TPA: molybdenum cofactor guanylyltransferase [Methanothrix sp.]|nr:molybdenum cofactor guanylyltransferase [Methanothrix sp.]
MRSAVILAGGSASRMGAGAEKALLEFEGKPLLCWTVEKLEMVADDVIVVARDEEHSLLLRRLVPEAVHTWDRVVRFGPVAGVDAGMRSARGSLVFATGCDLPFLNPDVVKRLFQLVEGYEAVVPVKKGFVEPLHSVYDRKRMIQACEVALARGDPRIRTPLQELRTNFVEVDDLRPLDPELLTFFNLNTPEDMVHARRLWSKKAFSEHD